MHRPWLCACAAHHPNDAIRPNPRHSCSTLFASNSRQNRSYSRGITWHETWPNSHGSAIQWPGTKGCLWRSGWRHFVLRTDRQPDTKPQTVAKKWELGRYRKTNITNQYKHWFTILYVLLHIFIGITRIHTKITFPYDTLFMLSTAKACRTPTAGPAVVSGLRSFH